VALFVLPPLLLAFGKFQIIINR